jgi:hypothetical protein
MTTAHLEGSGAGPFDRIGPGFRLFLFLSRNPTKPATPARAVVLTGVMPRIRHLLRLVLVDSFGGLDGILLSVVPA